MYFYQNLQVLPSESSAVNTLRFRGKFQYIFLTKFFPLEFEDISYNSVVRGTYSLLSYYIYCALNIGSMNPIVNIGILLDIQSACHRVSASSLEWTYTQPHGLDFPNNEQLSPFWYRCHISQSNLFHVPRIHCLFR